MKLPAGWTEIDDPTDGREYRHFEATYQIGRKKMRVELASRDASDDACLAEIATSEASIAEQGGKVVA